MFELNVVYDIASIVAEMITAVSSYILKYILAFYSWPYCNALTVVARPKHKRRWLHAIA